MKGFSQRYRKKIVRTLPVIAIYCSAISYSHQLSAAEAEPRFEIYGFAQADYIQDYRRVDPNWDDTLRPTRIPTTLGTYGSDGQAIIGVRQSRFGAKGNFPIENQMLKTKFEFDMFGVGPDEGKTTIRLRHAYGQWGQWLGGQTHSLFMDIDVFPNVIDYWGPAGMAFLRNPQLRWTPIEVPYSFSIAIEKPSNDIDPDRIRQLDPALGNTQSDEKIPDLTAQIRMQREGGHIQLGGIARRVGYDSIKTPSNVPKGFKVGWGFDLSTSLKFGYRDRLLLSGIYGQGIASYMNDGGVDLAPELSGGLVGPKAVPLFGLLAYYEHYWSERWSTTLGYSRTQVENTNLQVADAFFRGEYASVNLLYLPVPKVLMGIEALWGRRTDHNGNTGNDVRSQISFKYNFSSSM